MIPIALAGSSGRFTKAETVAKPLNLKLIYTKEQEPGSLSSYERRANILTFSGLKNKKSMFSLLLLVLFGLPVSVAYAGFFSFIGGLFTQADGAGEQKYVNSQTAVVLQAAINPDPNPSKGGGDIMIVGESALLPETGPSGTIADVESASPTSDQISVYVVHNGDSLTQIAKMFGVSVNTILWANDISRGETLREGQTLVVLPVSGIEHTVKKGDTLKGIAKTYGVDVGDILEFNDIKDQSGLVAGETLIIPGGEKTVSSPASASAGQKNVRGTNAPSLEGYYMRPISGGRKSQGLHGYNGVDLAAPIGTPIVASASGKVVISRGSGWNGGYGTYIVIEHPNGTQTLYAHNSGNIVTVGQQVTQGQVIGYMGNTGHSTGPHVHFEIRGAKNPF